MRRILFKVEGCFGSGYSGDYQNSYNTYCREVHYRILHNIKTGKCSMICIKPDNSCELLYAMHKGKLGEYNPCEKCEYAERCYEQGNPYYLLSLDDKED